MSAGEASPTRGELQVLTAGFVSAAEDSSGDDEPLVTMTEKAPTDEQLKATVQSLLKEANLKEMTMKQICQMVRASHS